MPDVYDYSQSRIMEEVRSLRKEARANCKSAGLTYKSDHWAISIGGGASLRLYFSVIDQETGSGHSDFLSMSL